MIIAVGSQNPTKIKAVENLIPRYEILQGAEVRGVDVAVEEFGHPKTLEETIVGAKQRATAAFHDCQLSVGLESGMMIAPGTKSGYLETTVCAIFDGTHYHIGLGPSFEWPKKMVELILAGRDGSQAFKELGMTDHQKVGTAQGGIHVLTNGRINRTTLNELAFTMALTHLEYPNLFVS